MFCPVLRFVSKFRKLTWEIGTRILIRTETDGVNGLTEIHVVSNPV